MVGGPSAKRGVNVRRAEPDCAARKQPQRDNHREDRRICTSERSKNLLCEIGLTDCSISRRL